MATMARQKLLDNLSHYGYSLMRPFAVEEPEELLNNLLDQEEARLLEGFPVVLANAMRKNSLLKWEAEEWRPSDDLSQQASVRLKYLLALSCLLYKLFGLEKRFETRTVRLLHKFDDADDVLLKVEGPFMRSESVRTNGVVFSTDRLKNSFRNYSTQESKDEVFESEKHVLELELLLAELFTPRQKDLLKKRLLGKSLTKTEREYFSRVVKKRLRALANEELHRLAHNLLHG